MSKPRSRRFTTSVAAGALLLGIALAAVFLDLRGVAENVADDATRQMAADVSGAEGYSLEEERALKAAVFVGRVVARDGDINIGEEGYPFILPIYAVDVETSLKGEAQGSVRLAVTQIGVPEDFGGNAVTVGDRYLFAAEGPDEDLYWIDEGLGSLRIANDDEAAALIAHYQQLISQVAQMPTPVPDVDPCGLLTASPTIDIDPNEGKAGRNVRVTAKRVSGPMVLVYWRNLNIRVGKGEVRADCETNIQIKVPNDARPGRYDIIIVDARDLQASVRFHVIE